MTAQKTRLNVPISGTLTPIHPETEIDQIVDLARQNSTAYTVGAVAFVASLLPLGLALKCTTAGTTAATAPSFSGAAVGGTITDGTVVWQYVQIPGLQTWQIPAFNKRDIVTTSGTYTAPVTGWYRIVVKGGGAGGAGGAYGSTIAYGGSGGGEGGTSIGYEKMTAGDTATVVIGAGGTGGAASSTTTIYAGTAGGNSTVSVNNNTYTGGGGTGAKSTGGIGGTGNYVNGACGESLNNLTSNTGTAHGATGGGSGGGRGGESTTSGGNGVSGGGGGGGGASYGGSRSAAGGKGGDGYAEFYYFDPSLN